MANYLEKNGISPIKRQELIRVFPCFATLTTPACEEMALLMKEVSYNVQEKIVIEDELVDSVYIIASGEAEVTRCLWHKKKRKIPLAILSAGDTIGLNDTGFYSATGKRTATVTALTKMVLLKLDLKELYGFLHKHQLESSMYAASALMLRIHFIKQSLPFTKLSHERLRWLADRVEEKKISAGTILFRQGEQGKECYLIRTGKIEIYTEDEHSLEKRLAILNSSVLFGEATLITNEKRNASARALMDTELLILNYQYLPELLESERNTANMFMTLMIDRSRPIKNSRVTVHERFAADGQKLTILKNPDNNSYFKLSEEGAFIWENLDGKHTLQEITLDMAEKFNVFAPAVVTSVIFKLIKSRFVTNVRLDEEAYFYEGSWWKKSMVYLPSLMEKRFIFGDSAKWISHIYEKYIRYLFTTPAQILLVILAISGSIAFIVQTPNVLLFFSFKHISLFLTLGLIPLSMVKVILHELGHAFAVKAFGREIRYLGIGINGVSPIVFADTSDMWLAQRKPRMLVNLAGIYVDILSAGVSSLLTFITANPYIQGMLWLFALFTYLGGFRHLNPTQDTDGYYALMDALEKNRLRHCAVLWLVKKFPRAFCQPKLFYENKAEIIYWLACFIYLVLVTLLIYMIQAFILTVIGIEESNLYLILIFPFLVTIFSSIRIMMGIKKETE